MPIIDPSLAAFATPTQRKFLETINRLGSMRAAARSLGLNDSTVGRSMKLLRAKAERARPEAGTELQQRGVQIPQAPLGDLTLPELLETKKKLFQRLKNSSDWKRLIPVRVTIDGPIGLVLFGDPHVDDDACDIVTLERDLNVVASNKAMFAGHVGDLTNNWIGRLAKKYADQVTTRKQAKMLLDWVLKDRPNLFVVAGNHDLWQSGEIIDWALEHQDAVAQPHGVRLDLQFPVGDPIRLHARHDFPGGSIYNDAHGLRRELAFGMRDHILVAGHRHTDAFQMIAHNDDPWVSYLLRVSGYKVVDDYADENRFIEKRFNPSCTIVIDPTAIPAEKVKPFWDSEAAADYLKFVRRRK